MRNITYLTSYLGLFCLFLNFSLSFSQISTSLSLSDRESGDDLSSLCERPISFCLKANWGSNIEMKIDGPPVKILGVSAKIYQGKKNIWESQGFEVDSLFFENEKHYYRLVADLTKSKFVGRAFLEINIDYLDKNNPESKIQTAVKKYAVCINWEIGTIEDCQKVCNCAESWRWGVMAGTVWGLYGGGPDIFQDNTFRPNIKDKFIGLSYSSPGYRYSYSAELGVLSNDFIWQEVVFFVNQPIIIATDTISRLQLFATPGLWRAHLRGLKSIALGNTYYFLLNAKVDGENAASLSSIRDNRFSRIQPEFFWEFRYGHPIEGLSLSARISIRKGGIRDVTDNWYPFGRIYLSYGF
ncbi:MAG: hypothetical protein AAF696_19160 [Bacteroidota bacterium]